MSVRFNHKIIIVISMILALAEVPLLACGPHFPNRVLLGGDNVVLKAPVANFHKEIERIKPPVPPQFEAVPPSRGQYRQQTATIDVAELENALAERNLGEEQRNNILEKYRAARKVTLEYVKTLSRWKNGRKWNWRTKKYDPSKAPKPQFNPPAIGDGLPGEFMDYLRGAISFHLGETGKAIDAWLDLLNRPVQERLYRSTWAAFMIGKTLLEEEPAEAIEWFRIVRQLAEEGFVDSLGLASSSLGWEAKAALNLDQYDQAIELYVAQRATGDPTAVLSLQVAAGKALGSEPEVLEEIARNTTARKVITAYVISHRRSRRGSWLTAVESANVSAVEEAERLALASYQMGEMDIAQRWLDVAPQDTTMSRWVRAKLLLRAGKIPEAADQLARISKRFPPSGLRNFGYGRKDVGVSARGELGVVYLSRRQYVESLDVLIRGGHWEDAAYVAERVLTPDELIEYVNLKWPRLEQEDSSGESYMSYRSANPNWFRIRIRYLLARRLSRLGRWDEARPYYPAKWQGRFDAYIQALSKGDNEGLSSQEQAAALWKAACIARYEGMELLGTEAEPDWFVWRGNFERTPASQIRGLPKPDELVPSTSDERRRLQENFVPEKRFHYRYTAADYAWQAAELMPNNSDETARVLCIAGSWLKVRDPQAADRFYKTLVLRCRKTKLGQEADKLRWFPKIEIDRNKLLEEVN